MIESMATRKAQGFQKATEKFGHVPGLRFFSV